MITLGVDPGLSMTGWGVVVRAPNNSLKLLEYGCIKTKPSTTLPERLKIIHLTLKDIIEKYRPQEMAIEELFFSKEARSVAAVSQARGVILLAAADSNMRVIEYNPRHVKISMTGYGSADKNQMQQMVKAFLKLSEIPKPDDAADAIAIAICHLTTQRATTAISCQPLRRAGKL